MTSPEAAVDFGVAVIRWSLLPGPVASGDFAICWSPVHRLQGGQIYDWPL
jgi:hypothetical protein